MAEILKDTDATLSVKKRLRYAAYKIVKEKNKSIADATVRELTDTAEISRATFYNYYNDINAFREETYDYLMELLIKQLFKMVNGGRENLRRNCKKKNLVFSDEDLLLMSVMDKFMSLSLVDSAMDVMRGKINIFDFEWVKDEKFYEENKTDITFFIDGFIMSVAETIMNNPEQENLYKTLTYCFDLYEGLFFGKSLDGAQKN